MDPRVRFPPPPLFPVRAIDGHGRPVPWSPCCQPMTANDRPRRRVYSQCAPWILLRVDRAGGSAVRESLRPPWPDRPDRCGCTASSCRCRYGGPAHGLRSVTPVSQQLGDASVPPGHMKVGSPPFGLIRDANPFELLLGHQPGSPLGQPGEERLIRWDVVKPSRERSHEILVTQKDIAASRTACGIGVVSGPAYSTCALIRKK